LGTCRSTSLRLISPVRSALLAFILFLSGASALIFQTLWLRLSGLVFGNSIWAVALILSSFMAGLALGSAIAASIKLRLRRPLRVYAALELSIALLGSSLVFGIPLLGEWLRPVFQSLWSHQEFLSSLRFSISFLILLLPTTAMGLTLPVLVEDPLLKQREVGPTIGILYGINTLGAVVGALLGEAYLVRVSGLLGTGLIAGSISCTAAAIAWLCSFWRADLSDAPSRPAELAPPPFDAVSLHFPNNSQPWRLLLVSMSAGAILLGLEVISFRFLRLYVASTSTAFSVMLAAVLVGIGLGSLVSSAIPYRILPPGKLLPFVLVFAGIAILLSYLFFPVPVLPGQSNAFHIESWPQIAWLSLALMFPVAFLSGMILPSVIACIHHDRTSRMNSAGLTFLFNTLGATLGPLLAAFILLPRLGFQSSLILFSASYLVLAICASEKRTWSFRSLPGIALLSFVAIFVLIIATFPYQRNKIHFSNASRPYQADGSHLIKRIEGTSDTFQLLRRDLYGEPYYYRLITNAYSMSGTLPRSQRYMRLFAYLPLALRPDAQNALLLCYGVGATADAFIHNPNLKHLDVVDTSKEVFELASYYSGSAYSNPLNDSRVTSVVQDARFFLQASPQHYDIITGEPPPLKVAGTVNLYTQQFFALIHDRLKDTGIATFWLPIYQLTNDETKAILRAFSNVFPNASVWATSDLDWIMMGAKGTWPRLDQERAGTLWANERTRSDLERIGLEVPSQISALFIMDGKEIERITRDSKPLTDFYPKRLSDAHPDLKAVHEFAYPYIENSAAVRRFRSSSLIKGMWPEEWKHSFELFFFVREMRYLAEISGSNWMADLDFYLRHTELRVPVLTVQNSDEFRLALAQKFAVVSPSLPADAASDLIAGSLAQRDFQNAIQLLENERARGFANPNYFYLLTYLYCLTGKVEKAEELAASNSGLIPKDWFMDWLWGDLQAEFGFQPPP
jgi:spermidine synthase